MLIFASVTRLYPLRVDNYLCHGDIIACAVLSSLTCINRARGPGSGDCRRSERPPR